MEKFFSFDISNVITWIVMVIGGALFWQRQSDKVDATKIELERLEKHVNERFDKQDRVLEEIKTTGSPSSRTAIMVLNSRVEGQSMRVAELEKIAAIVSGMATDIRWIKREMGDKQINE